MTFRPLAGLFLAAALAPTAAAQPPDDPLKKYPDFASVVKGGKEYESKGLFHLHLKDDHLYAEIQPFEFDRPFILAAAVAKGAGMGGTTLLGDEAWVLSFKKVGDRVFLVRKNTRFRATPGTPIAKAAENTYSDSVLASLPVKTINPMRGSTVIDLNQIFFSDFAQLELGFLDPSRTTWQKVRAYERNLELEVAATFAGGRRGFFGDGPGPDDVIDTRGLSLVLHYSLIAMPEFGYTPRVADDRVGHFISVVKDFNAGEQKDSAFVRYVNRWRLERADNSPWKDGGKLVPPKKKIVFWIEDTVPDEYRAVVREGILEWNKAFEKIGFRDAIEVRQQEGRDDFDPEDVTYSTFRWVTNEQTFAIGPTRVNPLTGEIIDADILFDASMVRAEKAKYRVLRDDKGQPFEPASDIQAGRRGWGLPADPFARLREPQAWNEKDQPRSEEDALRRKLHALRHGYCQCGTQKTSELALAVMHLAVTSGLKEGEKVPEELIQQAVKDTVMHEVGHTLGLRHNFKGSTVLPNDKLHDTSVTSKGLVGSVMDYNPANIAPKGTKQGHYFTPTIGPYDYWAIEYAYRPVGGDDELAKIAGKVADPALIYGTDEDLIASADPLVNQWDLGSDPLAFARDRVKVAQDLLPKLADAVVEKGEGYQRARAAFQRLLMQYGNAARLAAGYVGGEALYRDHKGDANGRDPLVPAPAAKQREALLFLKEHVLTDKPFDFPPELLRKLAADRWLHWGNEGAMRSTDFPLNARVLAVQQVALAELFDPATLRRVQDNAQKAGKDEKPLTVAEVFRAVTDSVFADLTPGDKAVSAKSSVVRRNLQRAYLSRLSRMVLGPKSDGFIIFLGGGGSGGGAVPADAKSLARMHLRDIGKGIDAALKGEKDDTVRAHLEESKELIAKVLAAGLTVNEP